MMRLLLPALLLAVTACGPAPGLDAPAPPERVVLVSLDTLRADHLGCYGAEFARTPQLDRLAGRGVRFANAIAPQPMTRPSHATLLTGLDPPFHGVRDNLASRIFEGLPTVAQHLRAAGFATAAVVSVPLLQPRAGFARGFDHYDQTLEPDGRIRGGGERRGDDTVDAALAWLEAAPERFFLWVHLFDPHEPWEAPGRLRRWLAASPYDAEISFTDEQVGRLVRGVERRFADARTLFVVVGDHGESLGEHGDPSHSLTIYDATQRVPLIFAGSGLPRSLVVEPVVRLADVAPTLLALTGAEPLPRSSGRDLGPLWEGAEDEPRIAYVETLATQINWGWSPLLGLRSDRYKYIRAPRPELYDLAEDPDELHDIAVERPELVAELDAELSRLLADAPAPEQGAELDAQTRAQLEALGYATHRAAVEPGRLGQVGGLDPKDYMHVTRVFEEASRLIREYRGQEALDRLAEVEGDFPMIHDQQALAALRAGKPGLAEHHARRALESGMKAIFAYIRLGNALTMAGRLDEAEAVFREALAVDPGNPDPLVALASVADRRGDAKQAEALLRQAMEHGRPSPRAYFMLAALLMEKGEEEEAAELLERLHPEVLETPDAAARLALAEARSGRREQALRRIERARRQHPGSRMLEEARAYFGGG